MARGRITLIVFMFFSALLLSGCGDEDYKSGMYWLNKKDNWQMAAKSFERALKKNPDKWKMHKMMLEALGRGDDQAAMENQVRETLARFPDSSRAQSVAGPGQTVLGEERYNQIAAGIEQMHLSRMLAGNSGNPVYLARGIMASCRSKDTIATLDYFERLNTALKGSDLPDSVIQEMNFFIGPAWVSWLNYEHQLKVDPNNMDIRVKQLNSGIIMGDRRRVTEKLREFVQMFPEELEKNKLPNRFGLFINPDAFANKTLTKGWDGAFSADGNQIVFVKEMGSKSHPDPYIYRTDSNGGGLTPLLKGVQYFLLSIAWPHYSPDGNWLYFYASPDKGWNVSSTGRFNLYRMRPSFGSKPEKLTDATMLPVAPFTEPDGSLLLVRRDVGSLRSSVQVVRLSPKTKEVTSISRIGEPVSGACFNTTGDSLIFTTDRGVFRRSIDGSLITVDIALRDLYFPQLSPDGKYLLVQVQQGVLLMFERETGNPTYLGTAGSPIVSFSKSGGLLVTRQIKDNLAITKLNLRSPMTNQEFLTAVNK